MNRKLWKQAEMPCPRIEHNQSACFPSFCWFAFCLVPNIPSSSHRVYSQMASRLIIMVCVTHVTQCNCNTHTVLLKWDGCYLSTLVKLSGGKRMYSVVYLSIRHAVSELRGELGGKRSLFQVAGRHGNPVPVYANRYFKLWLDLWGFKNKPITTHVSNGWWCILFSWSSWSFS